MILEHVLLPVRPGSEAEFEAMLPTATPIISSMPGFMSLSFTRCVERPSVYLLLVEWATLEDHTEGFRGSPQYQEWRALLHPFYEYLPDVEHFMAVHNC
ncbi:MAG: hypothetical protein QOH99_107 [Frankiaceae bacterium]|nr:hypothetical protein [Frankiaceae bacterium]